MVLTRRPVLERLADWLGDLAAETVVVTSPGAPASAERGFLHVHTSEDYSGAPLRREILHLAERFGVSRIGSLSEADVIRAAAVRHLLGLEGQELSSATAFRDKHVMKSLAAAAGLPVAPMRRAAGISEARGVAEALGYPVVVKPVDGGGGVGVRIVHGPADWEGVEVERGQLLVEAVVDESAFYVVDGLMREGRATVAVPLQMGGGALAYAQGLRPVTGYSLSCSSALHARLAAFADAVLGALPPVAEETAFHMEVFRDRGGELVLCEVASRAGGVGHAPVFTAVTGVDLNRASLLGQLGRPRAAAAPTRLKEAGFIGFPRREGRLVKHPEILEHPAVVSYTPLVQAGQRVGPARWAGDNVATLLVETPVDGDIAGAMAGAEEVYRCETVWA